MPSGKIFKKQVNSRYFTNQTRAINNQESSSKISEENCKAIATALDKFATSIIDNGLNLDKGLTEGKNEIKNTLDKLKKHPEEKENESPDTDLKPKSDEKKENESPDTDLKPKSDEKKENESPDTDLKPKSEDEEKQQFRKMFYAIPKLKAFNNATLSNWELLDSVSNQKLKVATFFNKETFEKEDIDISLMPKINNSAKKGEFWLDAKDLVPFLTRYGDNWDFIDAYRYRQTFDESVSKTAINFISDLKKKKKPEEKQSYVGNIIYKNDNLLLVKITTKEELDDLTNAIIKLNNKEISSNLDTYLIGKTNYELSSEITTDDKLKFDELNIDKNDLPKFRSYVKKIRITSLESKYKFFSFGGIEVWDRNNKQKYNYRDDRKNDNDQTNGLDQNKIYVPYENNIGVKGTLFINEKPLNSKLLIEPKNFFGLPNFPYKYDYFRSERRVNNSIEFIFDKEIPFTDIVILPVPTNLGSFSVNFLDIKIEILNEKEQIIGSREITEDKESKGGIDNIGIRSVIFTVNPFEKEEQNLSILELGRLSISTVIKNDYGKMVLFEPIKKEYILENNNIIRGILLNKDVDPLLE